MIVVKPYDRSVVDKQEKYVLFSLEREDGRIFDKGPSSNSGLRNCRVYVFNSGLGPAFNITFVARFGDQLLTSANPINELEEKSQHPVCIAFNELFLKADNLYTVYTDIYGSYHAVEQIFQTQNMRLGFLASHYVGSDAEDKNLEVIEYVKSSPIFFY